MDRHKSTGKETNRPNKTGENGGTDDEKQKTIAKQCAGDHVLDRVDQKWTDVIRGVFMIRERYASQQSKKPAGGDRPLEAHTHGTHSKTTTNLDKKDMNEDVKAEPITATGSPSPLDKHARQRNKDHSFKRSDVDGDETLPFHNMTRGKNGVRHPSPPSPPPPSPPSPPQLNRSCDKGTSGDRCVPYTFSGDVAAPMKKDCRRSSLLVYQKVVKRDSRLDSVRLPQQLDTANAPPRRGMQPHPSRPSSKAPHGCKRFAAPDAACIETRDYHAMHKAAHRLHLIVGNVLANKTMLLDDLVSRAAETSPHVRIEQIRGTRYAPSEPMLQRRIADVVVSTVHSYEVGVDWLHRLAKSLCATADEAASPRAASDTEAAPPSPAPAVDAETVASGYIVCDGDGGGAGNVGDRIRVMRDKAQREPPTKVLLVMSAESLKSVCKRPGLGTVCKRLVRRRHTNGLDVFLFARDVTHVPFWIRQNVDCFYLFAPLLYERHLSELVQLFHPAIDQDLASADWKRIEWLMAARPDHALVFDFSQSCFRPKEHLCFYPTRPSAL
jgi:hypothetical protein